MTENYNDKNLIPPAKDDVLETSLTPIQVMAKNDLIEKLVSDDLHEIYDFIDYVDIPESEISSPEIRAAVSRRISSMLTGGRFSEGEEIDVMGASELISVFKLPQDYVNEAAKIAILSLISEHSIDTLLHDFGGHYHPTQIINEIMRELKVQENYIQTSASIKKATDKLMSQLFAAGAVGDVIVFRDVLKPKENEMQSYVKDGIIHALCMHINQYTSDYQEGVWSDDGPNFKPDIALDIKKQFNLSNKEFQEVIREKTNELIFKGDIDSIIRLKEVMEGDKLKKEFNFPDDLLTSLEAKDAVAHGIFVNFREGKLANTAQIGIIFGLSKNEIEDRFEKAKREYSHF